MSDEEIPNIHISISFTAPARRRSRQAFPGTVAGVQGLMQKEKKNQMEHVKACRAGRGGYIIEWWIGSRARNSVANHKMVGHHSRFPSKVLQVVAKGHSPSAKISPTAVPSTGKGLLFRMGSLVPLNMFDSPKLCRNVS